MERPRRVIRQRTCCIDCSLSNTLDILEKLGLGCSGVSQQQHVDVTAQPMMPAAVLFLAAKKRQRNAQLDVAVGINAGRNAFGYPPACKGLPNVILQAVLLLR